jgi:hypothetical protein
MTGHADVDRLALLMRRLRLDEDDLLDAVTASAGWWQERARRDAGATTELAVELAARQRLAICDHRPHRYVAERRAVLDHPDPAVGRGLLTLLTRLWDLAPYVAAPAARSAALRRADAPPELIELADLLGEVPMRSVRTASLPADLARIGDAERVDTTVVAERVDALADEALATLGIGFLPIELRRLVPTAKRAAFLRELFGLHSVAVALLCWYSAAHPRHHATGRTLLAAMRQLNRLVEVSGKADDDPLFGLELEPADVVVTVAHVVDFEAALEAGFYRALALVPSPTPAAAERLAQRHTAGLTPLLDILEAGRARGVHVEALPSVRLAAGHGRTRTYGYQPDGHFPEPGELAEIIALGIDELSAPEDDVLLIGFLTAIFTLCRPKECLPRQEDVAPLASVHRMVYLDATTGKTGARELYVPACAVRLFGFSASWFASRSWADPHPLELLGLIGPRRRRPRWHKILPKTETDRAVATLEEACRRLRARYTKETGRTLVDRLAYVTRKLLAAYLWRLPIDPAYALTDVLGHDDLSGDEPYTAPMATEVLEQNTVLIEAARGWGAPR